MQAGEEPQRLSTPALPIGCMEAMNYDGAYEVQLPEGREMSLEDFIPLVAAPPSRETGLDAIRTAVGEMQGPMRFDDDVSLVEVLFH